MTHLVNFRAWIRKPASWVVLLLAAGVGVSLYLSLTSLANNASVAKKAALRQSEKDRADNATLCSFFRGTDTDLQEIFDVAPTTSAGSVIIRSLDHIQHNARLVAASALCPPQKPGG